MAHKRAAVGYGTEVNQPAPRSAREVVALVDALPIPALVALDPEVTRAYVNSTLRRLLGIASSKRVINFHTAPYVVRRNGRRILRDEAPLVRAARGEELVGEPYDFELPDGRCISVLAFAAPIREADGTLSGAVAGFLDVTDLRRSEERSAQRLRLLAAIGQELSEALNAAAIFEALARVLVPQMCMMLLMMTLDEEGRPQQVRMTHQDPHKAALIERLRSRHGITPQLFETANRVAQTNRAEFVGDREAIVERTNGKYQKFTQAIVDAVGIASYIAVPMNSQSRMAGVLIALSATPNAYSEDDLRMLEEIGRRAAAALQNAELFAHHERASTIFQEVLLPATLPKAPGLTFDAVYAPGDDRALIGGDWYDAFELPDGRIAVSIGDVTGRGTTAAAIMGKVRQTISGLSYYETDPVKLLDVAEMALMRRHPDSLVTAIVGIFDPHSGEFIYASAGHPPPLVRRADGIVLTLPCHGLPLGLRSYDENRSSVTFRMLPGDTLLLYTDGLTEVAQDPIAGEEATKRVFAQLPSYRLDAARYIQQALLPSGSRDDVALLSLQFDGGHSPPSVLRLRDVLEIKFNSRDARMARDLRVFITEFLRAYGTEDANYDGAELVLGELLGNVVRHASGPVELHLSWSSEYPDIAMLDYGPPYDASLVVPEDPFSESGRGLYIVGLLARTFHVTRLFGGVNETRAELDIPRRQSERA